MANRSGNSWDKNDLAEAVLMFRSGKTALEVAQRFHVSRDSACGLRRRLVEKGMIAPSWRVSGGWKGRKTW